ncbi:MAG: DNA polymerase III subunit gamma/tau, partial [Daejeonella sp.]
FLFSALNITNQCDLNYKTSKNQRLQVELALIKLCHLPSILNLSSVQITNPEPGEVKKKPNPSVIAPVTAEESGVLTTSAIKPEPEAVIKNTSADSVSQEKINAEPQEALNSAPEESKKIKISIPKPSLSGTASLIPNLNDIEANYSKKEEEKPEYLSGDSRDDFNSDTLLKYWNQYAEKIKKDGKINIFTIMTSNPPTLLGNFVIELIIENKVQEELLINEKVDLLNFLRTELRNFGIELTTRQIEATGKKRLYTSTEKYNHMVEKNPKLEEFRRRFNLDIDY